MKVSYVRLVVILFVLSMQQACVIPAAVDAMHRYTDYDVVTTEQIDENNFYTLVSVEHSRGRFNPLGDHGGPTVTTGMDYQLWHLQIADENLSATLLDEIKLRSEDEIDKWKSATTNKPLDKTNGRLLKPAETTLVSERTYPLNNLRVNAEHTKVHGLENNKNCSFELPPKREWKWSRQLLSSEVGTHLMIVDEKENGVRITLLDVCNQTKKIELTQSLKDVTGFAVNPDGNLKWITGISRELNYKTYYEVVFYPSQQRLRIDKEKLDPLIYLRAQQSFIFEEKSKRFHWIAFPNYDNPEIRLITHDFKSEVTSHRDVQLKPGRKNETTRTKI